MLFRSQASGRGAGGQPRYRLYQAGPGRGDQGRPFPFTRFGALQGKVVNIASAAIDEQDAKRALANATATANLAPEAATALGQQESFVFPVTVSPDETAMKIDSATIPLTPGMTVTVEIRIDSRRVIDYLLSPLAKIGSEALRER